MASGLLAGAQLDRLVCDRLGGRSPQLLSPDRYGVVVHEHAAGAVEHRDLPAEGEGRDAGGGCEGNDASRAGRTIRPSTRTMKATLRIFSVTGEIAAHGKGATATRMAVQEKSNIRRALQ